MLRLAIFLVVLGAASSALLTVNYAIGAIPVTSFPPNRILLSPSSTKLSRLFPRSFSSRCIHSHRTAIITNSFHEKKLLDANYIEAEVIRIRRDLHRIPELEFEEHKTAEFIVNYLKESGIDEITTGVAGTGVVALIRSNRDPDRRCIGIRADMDALPLQEESDLDYRSVHDGRMHACGHDAHVAMLLVAARVLQASRDTFAGTVKLIFQPAEEGVGGAAPMIAAGVLQNPQVDAVFGAHIWNYSPAGEIHVSQGPLMAAADDLSIELNGHGGHGAQPDGTTDAILATAQLVTQLHTITSRNISPISTGLVTIGTIRAGDNANIIAANSKITGIVRHFSRDVRDVIKRRINCICCGIETSFELASKTEYIDGYPATVNTDKESVDLIKMIASKVVGADNIKEARPTMAAEDFSYFLLKRPGCFFFIGSAPRDSQVVIPHHKSNFRIDEPSMAHGSNIWIELVREFLSLDQTSQTSPSQPQQAH